MNKNICNKENLKGHIKWAIANPDNEVHYYAGIFEDLFYISFSSFDGRLNLYEENRNIMESIDCTGVSIERLTDLFAAHIDIWIEMHYCKEETKPVDYEQKYWDCQRQIDEYERERKEFQEQIDILKNEFKGETYTSCMLLNKNIELRDDKKKAEQHIKELKEKISELESKNKQLDYRNTYITHQFGDERRAKERIEKRYISLHAAADSVLELINNAIDITKEPDPSWTLVKERLIAAHNELISYVEQKDDLTDFAKKSCEGCKWYTPKED